VVLEFQPTKYFKRVGRRFNLTAGLTSRCREHSHVLAYVAITSVLNFVPVLAIALAASVFTDRILTGAGQLLLQPVLSAVVIASTAIVVLTFVYHYYLRRLQIGLSISLNTTFIHYLLKLPAQYFDQRGVGEVISREQLNDDIATVTSQGVVQVVNDLVSMMVFSTIMFMLSVNLTLIAIAFTLPLYLYMRWSAASRTEASMAVALESGKASGIVIEGILALEDYKASGQESTFFSRWANAFASATQKQRQLSYANLLPQVLNNTLTQSATVALLLFGALEIINGSMSLGEVIAFQTLMVGFTGPLESLSKFYSKFQELQGELERLDDVLEHPVDISFQVKSDEPALFNENTLAGKLQIKDVCFRYSPVDPFLCKQVKPHR